MSDTRTELQIHLETQMVKKKKKKLRKTFRLGKVLLKIFKRFGQFG